MNIINYLLRRKPWTRCKYCRERIWNPTTFCPQCGADIDRQFAGMSEKDVEKVMKGQNG